MTSFLVEPCEEQEPADRRRLVGNGDLPSLRSALRRPSTEWTFDGPMTRTPELVAPKLGKVDSSRQHGC